MNGVYIFFPAYIAAGFLYIVVLSFFQSEYGSILRQSQLTECQGVYVDLRYHDILRIVCIAFLQKFLCIIVVLVSRTVTVYREYDFCTVSIAGLIGCLCFQCVNVIHVFAEVCKCDNLTFSGICRRVHICCIYNTFVYACQLNVHIASVKVRIVQCYNRCYRSLVCRMIFDVADLDRRFCQVNGKAVCCIWIRYITCHIGDADCKGVITIRRITDRSGMCITGT